MPIQDFLSGVRDRVAVTEEEPAAPAVVAEPEAEPDLFEEIVATFGESAPAEDPKPGRRPSKPARAAAAASRVTAAQKKAVADALAMMITLPAGVISMRDPVCGDAALEHCDNIVKKLTPIVCRNPSMVEWFTTGAGYLDWLGLASALAPLVMTVWSHHVTRPQEQEGDHAHPAGAPDFSHYTAPSLG